MPAFNPYEHSPETERESTLRSEAFRAQDWLGSRNERELVRAERDVLLEVVHAHLARVEPLLRAGGGFCFFRTWINEGERLTVVVTDNEPVAPPGAVIVSSNLLRQSYADEPCFPDGEVLEMADLAIPRRSRWLDFSWEVFEREKHDRKWCKPEFATRHIPKDSFVTLIGKLATDSMNPQPAGDLEGVSDYSLRYQGAIDVLKQCTEVTLEENVKELRR